MKAWSIIDRYATGSREVHELTEQYLPTFYAIERTVNNLQGDSLAKLDNMLENMWLIGTQSRNAPGTAG